MNKRIWVIIILFGILRFNHPAVFAESLKKIEVSGATINDVYKIQANINLNQFSEKEVFVNGSSYRALTIPEYGYTSPIGKPQLPAIRLLLAVPSLSNISLEILQADYSTLPKDYNVYPVQEPLLENQPVKFTIDKSFYNTDIFYPGELASIGDEAILRDYCIIQLEIFPFKYNPVTKKVRFYSDLIVELEFKEKPTKLRESLLFENLYDSMIFNYDSARNWPVKSEIKVGSKGFGVLGGTAPYDYLIIVYDDFYNSTLDLRDWKVAKGLGVEVTKTSEIPDGGDGLDDVDIRDYIKGEYEDWGISYVLLVGDIDEIPVHYTDIPDHPDNPIASDHYYSCLAGSDLYPEICIGRFSASSASDITTIANKSINYEKYPPPGSWVKQVLLVAHPQGAPGKYQGCKEAIANNIISEGFEIFKVYPFEGGTKQDVVDNINEGTSIVNYRGHGGVTSWSNPLITNNDLLNMNNDGKVAVMYSIACWNGKIDHDIGDCIAEAALKAEYCSIAYLGASRRSYTTENHEFDIEIFRAMFNDSIWKVGEVVFHAKTSLLAEYANGASAKYYILLGDPELEIWTAEPQFIIKDISGSNVAQFDDFGNLVLKGSLTQNTTPQATDNDEFRVQDSEGNDVAIIDMTNGNMYIAGLVQETWADPDAGEDEFVIHDSAGYPVAYIDESGNLYLQGNVYEAEP